jgi:hypothetical protein
MFSSLVAGASAFGVRRHLPSSTTAAAATMIGKRAFVSTTKPLQMANVLKLSDPQTQLLDKVDVFIFDCDGVIWRVRLVVSRGRLGSEGNCFRFKQNEALFVSHTKCCELLSMASFLRVLYV